MIPQFFGKPSAQLYGVYHAPVGTPRDMGVVLCYPFGQEYMRAHRAYRQLASLLAKKGFHVIRFDYRGTGDSSGNIESVQVQDWIEDVGGAIDEMRTVKRISSITVVGLRLGALIAAAACDRRVDVERLILWDPIVDGAAYEHELLAEIANEKPSPWGGPMSGNAEMASGDIYYNGFVLTAPMRESLRSLALSTMSVAAPQRVLLAVSHETPVFTGLKIQWQARAGFDYSFTPAPHDWNYVDNFGAILLPQPVIQSIVEWLE